MEKVYSSPLCYLRGFSRPVDSIAEHMIRIIWQNLYSSALGGEELYL